MHNFGNRSRKEILVLVAVHAGMAILFFGLLALVFGYIVMRLWNAVLPAILPVRPIDYWQAVLLLLLCRILVGRIDGGHGGKHGAHRQSHACPCSGGSKEQEPQKEACSEETEKKNLSQ